MKDKSKLVRDRIPTIIEEDGRKPVFYSADTLEHKRRLFEKMEEELREFREKPSVEEAADMYEVLLAIAEMHRIDMYDVILTADKKRCERGGFREGLVLETVDK